MEKLKKYLQEKRILFSELEEGIEIVGKTFKLVEPDEETGKLFYDEFALYDDNEFDYWIFLFGGRYYYTPAEVGQLVQLNELLYLGEINQKLKDESFLGVHDGYELLNGSRNAKAWIRKAKFLGIKNLGICDKNTLGGALKFQLACSDAGIKPVIGESFNILRPDEKTYSVKCFVRNEDGWQNLLALNSHANCESKFIPEKFLESHLYGLYVIIDPKTSEFKITPKFIEYYQVDTVEYIDNEVDKNYLINFKKFFKSDLKPVLLCDAYYLEKEHSHIRGVLNAMATISDNQAKNQHFKSSREVFSELKQLFKERGDCLTLFAEARKNLNYISRSCDFQVDVKSRHLPRYNMTEEEVRLYGDEMGMFKSLIAKGLKKYAPKHKLKEWLKRVKYEVRTIKNGDVVNYFLILWDAIRDAQSKGIFIGLGRGSAAGSLVAYLLGITRVNPLDFDLLFERFLNEGRIKKSLPDIDTDIEGLRRHEVKSYLEEKYGKFQVCAVGTYGNLMLKAGLHDLGKHYGIDFEKRNSLTKKNIGSTVESFFNAALQEKEVYDFVKKYPYLINDLLLILGQPRQKGIHACATMIFPKEKTMFEWCPIRQQEGVYITEWEGGELDSAGFLKEDLLGLKQLDQIPYTLSLIKQETGKDIDIYSLPLDDKEVYRYFSNGWNGSCFHFGSPGLTTYTNQMKPSNIDNLIAAIALYRPGTMGNGYHKEYIYRRNGEHDVEYHPGTEKILGETYGVFIYQEQIMKLCQHLGGLSLVEADDIRKAMGKKKYSVLEKYKPRFIKYYSENFDISEKDAEEFWFEIEKAASYLFNKSHAAVYSITGYISQWLKVHYPIEYWVSAFQFSKEDEIARYVNEIYKTGSIRLIGCDINKSDLTVTYSYEKQVIYWSYGLVKGVGPRALEQLQKEKTEGGPYFSLEEFYDRHHYKGSSVNKTVTESLIYSGAFDSIESLTEPRQRLQLIKKYRELSKAKIDSEKDIISLHSDELNQNLWWRIQEKKKSALSFLDYEYLCNHNLFRGVYIDPDTLDDYPQGTHVRVGGFVTEYKIREDREKGRCVKIILESNYIFVQVDVWYQEFARLEDELEKCKGRLLLLNGLITYNKHKEKNVVRATKKTEIKLF